MRSIRRGIKEMDILLKGFADENLAQMDDETLEIYEAILNENDQDLYQWVTGQAAAPEPLAGLIKTISQTYQK
ncbi:succinate dehydrogenase assembly factor 2 [Epibacterium sp. SM1969]|uniref:FAD assembly factor SdhE n=1 Tax=Tritonibacter aquimaris TaxID=2663379 RepID=A0A844ASZ9_9RHOB|nr:succinate dehydrogenase assembly factor 2 [Tritonibacter aquimaris]MQY42877.1 succinate dehydrogenase assembly factor 2 [Tritonibacter aquimaris]